MCTCVRCICMYVTGYVRADASEEVWARTPGVSDFMPTVVWWCIAQLSNWFLLWSKYGESEVNVYIALQHMPRVRQYTKNNFCASMFLVCPVKREGARWLEEYRSGLSPGVSCICWVRQYNIFFCSLSTFWCVLSLRYPWLFVDKASWCFSSTRVWPLSRTICSAGVRRWDCTTPKQSL